MNRRKHTRLEQLDTFIRNCLQLPASADDEAIRAALRQRQDKLHNWYENRRRTIVKEVTVKG